MKTTELLSIGVGVVGILVAAAALTAGPLDPPAGPIAPSYKTLTEVEPRTAINGANTPGDADSTFKITQPGSYYLTQSHVTKPGAFIGLEIASSNVTIDLNGFTLSGGGGGATRPGILATAFAENVTIRNGSVIEYQSSGIELLTATNVYLEGLTVKGSNNGGYRLNGAFRISRCIAHNNSVVGFDLSGPGVIQDSVANLNGGNGFQLSTNASALSCNANGNSQRGFESSQASLTNCSASNNNVGFQASSSALVGCIATNSVTHGISLSSSTATGCSASHNVQSGFNLSASNMSNCVSNNNNLHGVTTSYDSVIRDSTFMYNGVIGVGAGIHVAGDGNRIEGNNCGFQDVGVHVTIGGSYIARNTCRGNQTNWTVVAGNACLVVNATNSGAINGNAGGSSLGSTDPNANFSH